MTAKQSPRVSAVIPQHYYDRIMELVKENRFRNISHAVSHAVMFYLDYLERQVISEPECLPDLEE
jgi:Arc/MetJ-type ribon-helix-helix transcriptional regulator